MAQPKDILFVKSIFDDQKQVSSKFKLWSKPDIEFCEEDIIISSPFGKKKDRDSNEVSERIYFLTKTHIFYKASYEDPEIRGVLALNMTRLHHQILTEPVYGDYSYSLTFVRNRKFTEIYTNKEDTYKEWITILRLLTIQTDFHDRYKVEKMIGKGSFARVYLAKNLESQELFAIKAFNKEYVSKKEKGVENIREEIEITWTLNHRNLIKMIELHESENSVYMVLELLEGGEIFSLSGGVIQLDMALHILKELLRGVSYLHKMNIMHRDLKPENIVLKKKGVAIKDNSIKIVDFGLSAFLDDQPHCFVKCGTPGYAAPEVINCASDTHIQYDTKCDIFSLGIILFFMITGVMPYDGADFMEVLNNNRKGTINFSIPELTDKPKVLLDLLRGMLEIDPKKRFSAGQSLESPVFAEEVAAQVKKYTSVEDLDSCLRKFKKKFETRVRNSGADGSTPAYNARPDMAAGTSTYQNLDNTGTGSGGSTGSNGFIQSIDYNGSNGKIPGEKKTKTGGMAKDAIIGNMMDGDDFDDANFDMDDDDRSVDSQGIPFAGHKAPKMSSFDLKGKTGK